ncbi:MAG TPA: hypothetical protein VLV87_04430 [Gammaproteobacteria bacterium]|nr:hypothetical protein [Gammaproteobacteria bacterium]
MNIDEDNGSQNGITEQESGGAEMQAAGRGGSSSGSSRGGSRSKSASSRSSAHSGRNASGAAVDKDAQRRGGQHSHGGR